MPKIDVPELLMKILHGVSAPAWIEPIPATMTQDQKLTIITKIKIELIEI